MCQSCVGIQLEVRREDLDGLAMVDCCVAGANMSNDFDKAQARKGKTGTPGKQARKESCEWSQECSHFTYQR
jgi:hypothetical protein